ncbi:hypothetical protein KY320_03320, partial [Candidatus Woesearchaeota archaeon]|nr:hypothetical protein [Candidatus Woesearchaeota archaeon]
MRDMFERNEPGSSFYLPPTWQTDENGFGHHKSSEIETQIAYQPFIAGLNREHALLCAVTVGFIVSTLGAGILLGNH